MNRLKEFYQLNEYFGTKEAPARDVYLHDKACLDNSDVVVAELSYPSLGVGYEIGYALAAGKKVFAFAKAGSLVTRMLTGNTDPNFSFRTYNDSEEIIKAVKELI